MTKNRFNKICEKCNPNTITLHFTREGNNRYCVVLRATEKGSSMGYRIFERLFYSCYEIRVRKALEKFKLWLKKYWEGKK